MKIVAMKPNPPTMLDAMSSLEDAVTKNAGMMELLSVSALADRSRDGGFSSQAACGITLLVEDVTNELSRAYDQVREITKANEPEVSGPKSPQRGVSRMVG